TETRLGGVEPCATARGGRIPEDQAVVTGNLFRLDIPAQEGFLPEVEVTTDLLAHVPGQGGDHAGVVDVGDVDDRVPTRSEEGRHLSEDITDLGEVGRVVPVLGLVRHQRVLRVVVHRHVGR